MSALVKPHVHYVDIRYSIFMWAGEEGEVQQRGERSGWVTDGRVWEGRGGMEVWWVDRREAISTGVIQVIISGGGGQGHQRRLSRRTRFHRTSLGIVYLHRSAYTGGVPRLPITSTRQE